MSHLSDLETVLIWEGGINNERIRELLDVKVVWASRLIAELEKKLGSKARRSSSHAPLQLVKPAGYVSNSPDEYLRVLRSNKQDNVNLLVEDARFDLSNVSPDLFSVLFQAIKHQKGVEINYRSMNYPEGTKRLIFPHAFVRVPRRWHVRAWCAERQDYRDFTLGRIAEAAQVEKIFDDVRKKDKKWHSILNIKVIPHPKLSQPQQEMIAQEYFPGRNHMKLKVRECLAPYVVQDLRIAVDEDRQPPPEYQLLANNVRDTAVLFGN